MAKNYAGIAKDVLRLALIGADGVLNLAGSSLTGISRWFSTGATLAAVIEHAHQELELKGTFDPEVMSVVYLINSIGKTNSVQASLVAWAATFGCHLIPRAPREQVYRVRREGRRTTLIPGKYCVEGHIDRRRHQRRRLLCL